MSPFVELGFEGPLARLTLKRADKLNALDRAMIDALADAALADTCHRTNPRPCTRDDFVALFRDAL